MPGTESATDGDYDAVVSVPEYHSGNCKPCIPVFNGMAVCGVIGMAMQKPVGCSCNRLVQSRWVQTAGAARLVAQTCCSDNCENMCGE